MAWDEWEQLKAEAAEHGGSVHTQINQVADPGGSSTSSVTGGLKTSRTAWNKAGGGVGGLRDEIDTALTKLSDGQKGLGGDAGCVTAGAQQEVYRSWARYVKSVKGRCGDLKEVLEQVGHDLLLTDEGVRAALGNIDLKYADTTAVGGKNAGR
ncbi:MULTISPECIES: hypothetical protein [Streptomyces]|uniref:Amino acid ABC transporter permease n=1 Tax=Streptomyces lienomycini TaxID=284035 RepID=A0ABV9WLZ6_9ACTN|nr:hypothetical protein [Streptomyces lienomycini]